MALGQGLYQKLLQKLSPQQIQLMKLLQVPTVALEERILQEIEENPALEIAEDTDTQTDEPIDEFETDNTDTEVDGSQEEYDDIDISEYVSDGDDDIADYKTKGDSYNPDEEERTKPISTYASFNETMVTQLNMLQLSPINLIIAEQIIGSLDEDGYLRRELSAISNDLAFKQNITVSTTQIQSVLTQIQQLEPPGIAARNLQECLLLQLRYVINNSTNPAEINQATLASKILSNYFDEFIKKHYEKIERTLNITSTTLKNAIQLIIKLNPKPASNMVESNKAENFVVPDYYVFNNAGSLELTLNQRNAPELKISEGYRDMLRHYEKSSKNNNAQKEAVLFIKQKIDSAKWFIDAIQQRQNTMLLTMNAILSYQKEFFLMGDDTDLRPMILKDIAAITGLDISTISRVANSKFVQTEFGTFKLKHFFSEGLTTDSGEEVSTREVKKILMNLITNEPKNKPLSDDQLTTTLQQKGYNIARRTVAKYREQLNLPVARLRKQL